MSMKTTRVDSKDITKLYSQTFPNYVRFAVANTLTKGAFLGMRKSEQWIKRNWNLRNKFLLGGGPGKGAIKYDRALPSRDINSIFSKWGSVANVGSKKYDFMEKQEGGFNIKGTTPTNQARTGKNYKKRIPPKRRRHSNKIQEMRGGSSSKRMTLVYLRRTFKKGFALPGSGQYFYMKDNQFLNFGAGLYQFTRKTIPQSARSKNTGAKLQFPNLKKVYIAGKQNRKTRKDSKWMLKSSMEIKQSQIDKIFEEEADRAFAGQLRLWKHR